MEINVFDEEESNNKWNISILQESEYWEVYLIKIFIYIPDTCPYCKTKK